MPERHSTKELFAGVPDWVVAEWCCVHIQTARHWKSGIRKPGPTALKLFLLHREGRVLESPTWNGWGVLDGKLCDPEGHEITQAQLRVWPFVWQLAAQYAKLDQGASEYLERMLRRLDPPPKKQRGRQEQRQAGRALLPRVTPDPSTLPTMILPRSTRKRRA